METTYEVTEAKDGKFKSYYVVWKLRIEYIEPFLTRSLNRTMQYGNDIEAGKIVIFKQRLNRTMQYGNMPLVYLAETVLLV